VSLLTAIVPKEVAATITRNSEVTFSSIAELDADLAKHGLPPTREIFAIDYGNAAPADEVVEVAKAVVEEGKSGN
jgi:hypothetical protein